MTRSLAIRVSGVVVATLLASAVIAQVAGPAAEEPATPPAATTAAAGWDDGVAAAAAPAALPSPAPVIDVTSPSSATAPAAGVATDPAPAPVAVLAPVAGPQALVAPGPHGATLVAPIGAPVPVPGYGTSAWSMTAPPGPGPLELKFKGPQWNGEAPDPEASRLSLEDAQLGAGIRELAVKYKGADAAGRPEVERVIADHVTRQFELRQAIRERQLKALEEQVTRLRTLHAERANQRDRIVADRVQQLLREAQGLGWGEGETAALPPLNVRHRNVLMARPRNEFDATGVFEPAPRDESRPQR